MDIVKVMDWNELKYEYQLDGKRVLPWEGWDMPFGGAWCVVRPMTESLKHSHDEQEMFFIVSGEAIVHVGERPISVKKGDFIAIPPGEDHYVQNRSDTDFHFLTIWWDGATCGDFIEAQKDRGLHA